MEVDWNAITGQIITTVLKIIAPVCVALVLKWAGELWLKIKGEHPDLAELLGYAVQLAVESAEQIFGKGNGAEKKQYAIEVVKKYLAEFGLSVDVDVIADAIEHTVYRMNYYKRERIEARNDTAEQKADE